MISYNFIALLPGQNVTVVCHHHSSECLSSKFNFCCRSFIYNKPLCPSCTPCCFCWHSNKVTRPNDIPSDSFGRKLIRLFCLCKTLVSQDSTPRMTLKASSTMFLLSMDKRENWQHCSTIDVIVIADACLLILLIQKFLWKKLILTWKTVMNALSEQDCSVNSNYWAIETTEILEYKQLCRIYNHCYNILFCIGGIDG